MGIDNIGNDMIQCLLYWQLNTGKGEANCLILASHRDAMEENLQWITSKRNNLGKNVMLNFFINSYDDKPSFINKRIFQTLTDGFHQVVFANSNEESSKLRTYATF